MIWETNLLVLVLTALVTLLAATELGFRLGRWRQAATDEHLKAHVGSLQAALLGLLALLLGFTFAMAVSRFDTRKELVLEEANAIGTTYLRAKLLPEAHQQELKQLLRSYVEARLTFHDVGADRGRLDTVNATTARLHEQLWSVAIVLAEQDPRSVPVGLFIQSLNEVIDLHEKRLRALENHVPETVLVVVFSIMVVALGFIGHGCGLGGRRHFLSTAMVSLLLTLVLSLILDLDRPRRGLITVSQASMISLKQALAADAP